MRALRRYAGSGREGKRRRSRQGLHVQAPASKSAHSMDKLPSRSRHHNRACTSTFVLRLRLVWRDGRLSWRGWMEHFPSGDRAAVQDWEGVAAFVASHGVGWGEEGRPQADDQGLLVPDDKDSLDRAGDKGRPGS